MKTEFEIKILNIVKENIEKQLIALGFNKTESKYFKRYIYELDDKSWIRLRTDGNSTTLTLKKYLNDSIDGVKETEIKVDNIEKTNELLDGIGLNYSKYQENKRAVYLSDNYPGVEVVIDEWPKINPYMEIEANSEDSVKALLNKLDIKGLDTTSAPTSEVYRRAGLDLDSYTWLVF
jgi:adenylate cyclase class 2